MAEPSNFIERDFLEAAAQFQELRPWESFAREEIFYLQVPTERQPLVASIMGDYEEEYGLALLRGEDAYQVCSEFMKGALEADDFADHGNHLTVAYQLWEDIPNEYRKLHARAGLEFKRGELAPMACVSKPHCVTEPAHQHDLVSLTWALRGALEALKLEEFDPSAVDEERAEVLELRVNGPQDEPFVQVDWIPKPGVSFDPPPLLMLPGDLRELPRLDERWLITRVPLHGSIEGDVRIASTLLVCIEDGPIRGFRMMMGSDLQPLGELFASASRASEPGAISRGLPREVLFNQPRPHDALAPALAALNVPTKLEPLSPAFDELLDELGSILEQLDKIPDAPLEAIGWERVNHSVVEELGLLTQKWGLVTDRAMKRYFGDESTGEDVRQRLERLDPIGALMEWLVADYRATNRSKTVIEKQLQKKRLGDQERTMLQARLDAKLSIFTVLGAGDPGMIELQDVLDGELITAYDMVAHDIAASHSDASGYHMPLRLLRVDGWTLPVPAGPTLNAQQLEGALSFLESLDVELTPEGLRKSPHLIGQLWTWLATQ